jgi:hypothetical protein
MYGKELATNHLQVVEKVFCCDNHSFVFAFVRRMHGEGLQLPTLKASPSAQRRRGVDIAEADDPKPSGYSSVPFAPTTYPSTLYKEMLKQV